MINIAILGFGVVGSGVAKLITENKKEVTALGGDEINIKYILDLRDFPDSPFADKVIHDYTQIVNDPDVSVVIEVMGGSHPAYEYTVSALRAGKSVITSNKEVVANFGDEFLAIAKEKGVCYRFEAAVGGGIPVISPIISHFQVLFNRKNTKSQILIYRIDSLIRTAQAAWAPLLKKRAKRSVGTAVINVNFRQFASELSVLKSRYILTRKRDVCTALSKLRKPLPRRAFLKFT